MAKHLSDRVRAAALPPTQEAALWEAARAGAAQAREQLIEAYLPFARIVTAKLYAGRNDNDIEFDDYQQYATIGLIEAIDRYDPGQHVLFKTFAGHRIQGAVLDGLTHLSEKREQVSVRQQLLAERRDSAKAALNDSALDLFQQLADVAIGLAVGYLLDDPAALHDYDAAVADNQYSASEMRQLRQSMHALVERLPQRERMVIKYHYLNHVPFAAIAATMSLSKSRVAQIHRQGLDLMAEMMQSVKSCDIAW